MTDYGKFTTQKSTSLLSHDLVAEKKAARRKVLDAVFQRRKLTHKQYNLRKIQEYYQHSKNSPDFN